MAQQVKVLDVQTRWPEFIPSTTERGKGKWLTKCVTVAHAHPYSHTIHTQLCNNNKQTWYEEASLVLWNTEPCKEILDITWEKRHTNTSLWLWTQTAHLCIKRLGTRETDDLLTLPGSPDSLSHQVSSGGRDSCTEWGHIIQSGAATGPWGPIPWSKARQTLWVEPDCSLGRLSAWPWRWGNNNVQWWK